jgi:hypothetical protein
MRVPWNRFREEYARYPRWLAFTLWTRAILAAEDPTPSWLVAAIKKRCPGFIDNKDFSVEPGLLGLRLQEWIHKRIFREASEDGWLDALIFFGVRDLRSQATWAYSEHCEKDWERRRPRSFSTFEKWWQTARQFQFCEKATTGQIATALQRYLRLQAVAYWLHTLLRSNRTLSPAIAVEMKRKYPGLLEFSSSIALREKESMSAFEQRLTTWMGDRDFAQARKEGWLNVVIEQMHNDPHHVRMVEFWQRSNRSRFQDPRIAYPSFKEWCRAADSYIAG